MPCKSFWWEVLGTQPQKAFEFLKFQNPWQSHFQWNQDLHCADRPKLWFKICFSVTIWGKKKKRLWKFDVQNIYKFISRNLVLKSYQIKHCLFLQRWSTICFFNIKMIVDSDFNLKKGSVFEFQLGLTSTRYFFPSWNSFDDILSFLSLILVKSFIGNEVHAQYIQCFLIKLNYKIRVN